MRRSFLSVLVFLLFSTFVAAQNNCRLVVRIRAGNERSVEMPMTVEVLSPEGFMISTVTVMGGDSGQVQVMSGKTYLLRVSGTGIDTVTTPPFDIESLEAQHTETVHVKVASQKQGSESTPGSGTVSVSEMMIPEKAGAEMKKGLDAYSGGDMAKAEAHFEKAAADYPHYARAYDLLGAIAIREPNRNKARELFSKSIEADPTFYAGYLDLARMDFQDRQYPEAESLLGKAIALNPSMPDALALLVGTEFANKQYDKVVADTQRTHALPHHEQFAEVHLMAAKVLRMQNRPQEAIAQFRLFLKEKPDSPEAEQVRKAIASLDTGKHP